MNSYTYDELTIGQNEKFSVTITSEMMEAFKGITGDCNPLHTDINYARTSGYSSCVSYGMLTASFLSTLAGVYLPGEKSLIQEVLIKLVKPVFEGDVLSIEGTIIELNETFRRLTLKVLITNQYGQKVLRGNMKVGVLK